MKNKSSFVRRHGFGVVGMLLLGVLGMCLFSIPAEAFSLSIPPLPKIPMPSPMTIVEIVVYTSIFILQSVGGDSQDS